MLIENYIEKEFITIKTHYDLFKILNIFEETNYDCLPVVENEKYMGLILEKDIFEIETVADDRHFSVSDLTKKHSILYSQTLFDACNMLFDKNIDVVPVVDENDNYLGVLTERNILKALAVCGQTRQNTVIDYEVNENDLHLSEFAYLVEENNAKIVTLSVIPNENSTKLTVLAKLDTANILPVVQSLERHGYTVNYTQTNSEENYSDLERNYENLMRYLSV
ncbi:MAG: CBS domain-containing protein [Bacteroidales bacterium]|nr:CBS domain-containing protein [Bacteroidales bacterium]